MRRRGALLILVALLVGAPAVLVTIGFYAWSELNIWSGPDARVALAALTVLGWASWAAFFLAVAVESVALLSGGRRSLRLPGLAFVQSIASAWLIAAFVANHAPAVAAPQALAVRVHAETSELPVVVEQPRPDAHDVVHTVAAGDDLWSLAERYYADGSRWRDLVETNRDLLGENPTRQLIPGTSLLVKRPLESYRVKKGDTLWALAEQRLGDGQRFPELQRLNANLIKDPHRIQVGWALRLPIAEKPDAGTPAVSDVPGASDVPAKTGTRPAGDTPAVGAAPSQEVEPSEELAPAERAASAEGNVPVPTVEATVVSPGADSDAVRRMVGALGALAAAAALSNLAMTRRRREVWRPIGRRFIGAEAPLARLETALGWQSVPDRRDKLVEVALRSLTVHWWRTNQKAAALRRATLDDDGLCLWFEREMSDVPLPMRAEGACVRTTWNDASTLERASAPTAFPALVTLGNDADGAQVLVDLAQLGVLAVEADDRELAVASISAMLLELSGNPWSSEVSVHVVARDARFAAVASQGDVTWHASVTEGLEAVEAAYRQRRALLDLGGRTYEDVRLDPDVSDAWLPEVFLFEMSLEAEQQAWVAATLDQQLGLAVVFPRLASETVGLPTLRLDDGVRYIKGRFEPDGLDLAAQVLAPSTRVGLIALHARAVSAETVRAEWWADEGVMPGHQAERVTVLDGSADAPRMRLFGPPTLAGARGVPPEQGTQRCLEVCAWLLTHQSPTLPALTADLIITDSARRLTLQRLRAWLGVTPSGELYVPEAIGGAIRVSPEVNSDWAQMKALLAPGVNVVPVERLREALRLASGPPLQCHWLWASELRAQMRALVRDVAVVLARAERERGNLDGVQWACDKGLRVVGSDELLACEMLALHRERGESGAAERLIGHLIADADERGMDLAHDTVTLLQTWRDSA